MRQLVFYAIIMTFIMAFVACKSSAPQAAADGKITEKYWKLVELQGMPVVVDSAMGREPHIILKNTENRLNGNSGCNTLAGTYEFKKDNTIAIGQLVSTKMACPDMQTEMNFLNVLQQIDTYSVIGDTLTLSKAGMAPLARLTVVHMK